MPGPPTLRTVITALAALALVAGAATPVAAGGKRDADRAIAEAALLQPTDLAAGWVAQPATDRLVSGVPECRSIETAVRENKRRRQSSPDFERQPASRAQNSIYAFSTVAAAKRFFRVFTKRGARACFDAMVRAAVRDAQPDATVESRTFDETGFDTGGLGEDVAGIEFTITIPASTGAVLVFVTAMAVRVDRFFDGFTFQHTSTPLPEAPALVLASLTRLDAGIAAS